MRRRRWCPTVVISQVYGGGGNTGATFTTRLHRALQPRHVEREPGGLVRAVHRRDEPLAPGRSRRSTGSIAPGGYYLVQQAAGTGGTTALPTPDATGTIAMAAGAGKVALRPTRGDSYGRVPGGRHLGRPRRLRSNGELRRRSRTDRGDEQHTGRTAQARRVFRFRQQQRRLLDRLTEPAQQRGSAEELRASFRRPFTTSRAAGSSTPFLGQDVTTTGIVTGRKTNGFFLQTPDDGGRRPGDVAGACSCSRPRPQRWPSAMR